MCTNRWESVLSMYIASDVKQDGVKRIADTGKGKLYM